MPELRQNRFTKEWVIIANERARRPEEFSIKRDIKPLPAFSPTCPFCPGNEAMAPPDSLRIPAENSVPWQVRVVPNKFAAVSPTGQPERRIERSKRAMNAVGFHDVIVETPDHSLTTALLPDAHVSDL